MEKTKKISSRRSGERTRKQNAKEISVFFFFDTHTALVYAHR